VTPVTPGGDGEMAVTAATAEAEIRPTVGMPPMAGTHPTAGLAAATLTGGDIGALALALGFAGTLLVPLFYAAHKMANKE